MSHLDTGTRLTTAEVLAHRRNLEQQDLEQRAAAENNSGGRRYFTRSLPAERFNEALEVRRKLKFKHAEPTGLFPTVTARAKVAVPVPPRTPAPPDPAQTMVASPSEVGQHVYRPAPHPDPRGVQPPTRPIRSPGPLPVQPAARTGTPTTFKPSRLAQLRSFFGFGRRP